MKHLDNTTQGEQRVGCIDGKRVHVDRPRLPLVAPLKARLADWRKRWRC